MTTNAHRLPNGMLVLTREVRSAPVATSWVWYRVGSRNERPGGTGLSHWVEHMLFKGTPNITARELDLLVARNGGVFNAFTSFDYTAYYETLPAEKIELALRIESDRMVGALFDPEEVESERTVILSEREGYENDPEWWLGEAMSATAFTTHPYRHDIIGTDEDLRAITRDQLYAHYQTYYMPNNAVLALVGDFETDAMLRLAEQHFGALPVGPAIPPVETREPEQDGERRVTVRRPGPAQYVQIAYHTPSCRHPDYPALVVLDAVLSGAKAGGGAQTNRSARLYRALVETGLATYASSSFRATIDPHLFEFSALVQDGHTADAVEAGLIGEVAKVQQDGVSTEELAKIQKQVRAQIAYSGESVTNQAFVLGMWETLDRYERAGSLLEAISAVTPADVQRVAQVYLTERCRTVGHFIPTEEAA